MSDVQSAVVAGTFALAGFFISNLVNGYNNREQARVLHKSAIEQSLINIRIQRYQEFWQELTNIHDHGMEIITGSKHGYSDPGEDRELFRKESIEFRKSVFNKLIHLKIWMPPDIYSKGIELFGYVGKVEFTEDVEKFELMSKTMNSMHHKLAIDFRDLLVPTFSVTDN